MKFQAGVRFEQSSDTVTASITIEGFRDRWLIAAVD
jgi:hypothetical protein